jgi:hypothetical protein
VRNDEQSFLMRGWFAVVNRGKPSRIKTAPPTFGGT